MGAKLGEGITFRQDIWPSDFQPNDVVSTKQWLNLKTSEQAH
jgi:hypothetical protein